MAFNIQSTLFSYQSAVPLSFESCPSSVSVSRFQDEVFVQNFTSNGLSLNKKSFPETNTTTFFELRRSMSIIMQNCNILKKEEASLREHISVIAPEEWDKRLAVIGQLKNEIDKESNRWENKSVVEALKVKMAKRHVKRARQKRKKTEMKEWKRMKHQFKASESEMINNWINKAESELQNKKKVEENNFEADIVLRDVTKRKTDARRNLLLLGALCNLREAKEKSILGCGRNICLTDASVFSKNIDMLKAMWAKALSNYTSEEKMLRKQLQINQGNASEHVIENVINGEVQERAISLWKIALFGNDLMPYRQFDGSNDTFIFTRTQWDQYVCWDVDSSSIPVGWVSPPTTPKSQWENYLLTTQ